MSGEPTWFEVSNLEVLDPAEDPLPIIELKTPGPGDSFSAVINSRKKLLTIAGVVLSPEFVYTLAPGTIIPDDKRYGIIFMNRRALEAATNMDGAFNDIVIKVTQGSNETKIMDRINTILAPYGGIDPKFCTNPIALTCPSSGDPFLADFSSTTTSWQAPA